MDEACQPALSPRERSEVLAILDRYVPTAEIWVYGSRANGSARSYSDLDLAIVSDSPLSATIRSDLAEAFSDSNLPWRVDVLDWASARPEFQAIVAASKSVLREARAAAVSTP